MSDATTTFRMSSLSARTPPNNDRNNMGSIMPAGTRATRNGEPVNCSMSQPLVSICMEYAVKARKPANQYMRNWPDLITPSGLSLRRARTGRLFGGASAVVVGPVRVAVSGLYGRRSCPWARRENPTPDPPAPLDTRELNYPPTNSVIQVNFFEFARENLRRQPEPYGRRYRHRKIALAGRE